MYYNMSINGYNEHYNNIKLNNIYTELYNLDNDLTINGILTVDNVNVKNKLVSDYITVYNGLMIDSITTNSILATDIRLNDITSVSILSSDIKTTNMTIQ